MRGCGSSRLETLERRSEVGAQLGGRGCRCGRGEVHEVGTRTEIDPRQLVAKHPAEAVASHRGASPAADTEGHSGAFALVSDVNHRHGTTTGPHAAAAKQVEGRSITDAPRPTGHERAFPRRRPQADSRWRPLVRRALMIARPARVDMRCRKPCRLARLRLLGWNGRFTKASCVPWRSNPGGDGAGRGRSRAALARADAHRGPKVPTASPGFPKGP